MRFTQRFFYCIILFQFSNVVGVTTNNKTPEQHFGIAAFISVPVLCICIVGGLIYYFHIRKSNKGTRVFYAGEESLCEPAHPNLGASTIKDMIELTTSGSGSGFASTYF